MGVTIKLFKNDLNAFKSYGKIIKIDAIKETNKTKYSTGIIRLILLI